MQIFNKDYKLPASFKVHQFVIRVGDYGGYMVMETDNPAIFTTSPAFLPIFEMKVEPVMDVMDAVAANSRPSSIAEERFINRFLPIENSHIRMDPSLGCGYLFLRIRTITRGFWSGSGPELRLVAFSTAPIVAL